ESFFYDENGNPISPQTPSRYGYTGKWQKKRDPDTSLIRMGIRMLDPLTGRFTSRDPVDGGSLNSYDYAGQDAVNGYDLSGRYRYEYTFDVGPGSPIDAISMMFMLLANPNMFFPFHVYGRMGVGRHLSLGWGGWMGPVRVEVITLNGFVFRTLPGHVEGTNATIGFELKSVGGRLRFRVKARGPSGRLGFLINPFRHFYARRLWGRMAGNFRFWNWVY
ncbi:MAG: RHS repeat-associated core domain-containing protein, partial [Actinomycetota bacterium]